MLVAVREISRDEVSPPPDSLEAETGSLERFYSLYANDISATVVDVTDGRARKTFNFDVRVSSNTELAEIVVHPLLETIVEPDRASQSVLVCDGTRLARDAVLFGGATTTCQDGLLVQTVQRILEAKDVATVFLGGVTLDDNNRLTDVLSEGDSNGASSGPTILEDTKDQFTAVEETTYREVTDEETLAQVAWHLRASLSETKHQIFPIIVAFDEATGMPNTTFQFVSFCVGEMARGMKSTRHCVSTAASLIECRSPVMPFNGTKVSFLLKPAMLGTQPGAWVSCFSPMSFVGEEATTSVQPSTPGSAPRETFKEAFSVAQMASRVYSSRIGVTAPSLPQLTPKTLATSSTQAPAAAPAISASPKAPVPAKTHPLTTIDAAIQTPSESLLGQSGNTSDTLNRGARHTAGEPQATHANGLVDTPSVAVRHAEALTSARREPTDSSGRPERPVMAPLQRAQDNEDTAGTGATTNARTRNHELEAYKAAMETAMHALRDDVRTYAQRLEVAKDELRKEQERNKALLKQTEDGTAGSHQLAALAQSSQDEAKSLKEENQRLREKLAATTADYEDRLHKIDAQSRDSQLRLTAEMGSALTRLNQSQDARLAKTSSMEEEIAILRARVSELLALVAYHQQETEGHVDTEKAYRERILSLEAAVREQREENRILCDDLLNAKDRLKTAEKHVSAALSQQVKHDKETTAHMEREAKQHAERQEKELRELQESVTGMATRLEEALRVAERERTRRAELEQQLAEQRRLTEELTRDADIQRRQREEQLTQEAKRNYENQLTALQAELKEFKDRVAEQQRQSAPISSGSPPPAVAVTGIHVLPSSTFGRAAVDSSRHTERQRAEDNNRQRLDMSADSSHASRSLRHERASELPPPPPPPPAPPHTPSYSYRGAETSRSHRFDDSSVLSQRSSNNGSVLSGHRGGRPGHHRSRSFEDFMQEAPSYQLRQNVPLNFPPRNSRFDH